MNYMGDMSDMEPVKFLLSQGICGRDKIKLFFEIDYAAIEAVVNKMLESRDPNVDYIYPDLFIKEFNLKVPDYRNTPIAIEYDAEDKPYIFFTVTRDYFIVNGKDETCYVVEFHGKKEK